MLSRCVPAPEAHSKITFTLPLPPGDTPSIEVKVRLFLGSPRREATNATLAAAVLLLFIAPAQAQNASVPEAEIKALIEQLGAPQVRLREEAEEKLKTLPEAFDLAKVAAKDSSNAEIRLRARNVIQTLRQNLWQQQLLTEGHRMQPDPHTRAVVVSPDGKRFYTRGEDHVRAWDAETAQPGITFGEKTGKWRDWQRGGPVFTLAVSPDSKRVVSTDDIGTITIHSTEDGSELLRFANDDPAIVSSIPTNHRTLWGASFFPDGRLLATCDRGGWMRIWISQTGELVKSVPLMPGQANRTLAVSPDGKLIAVSIDYSGEPDYLWIWNVERAQWTHKQQTSNRLNTLAFATDSRRLLGAQHGACVDLWNVTIDGRLIDERRIGPVGTYGLCAVFSADEKSIFVATDDAEGQLIQWDAQTGEELWRSPSLGTNLEGVAVLDYHRLVTVGKDGRVRLWQRVSNRK